MHVLETLIHCWTEQNVGLQPGCAKHEIEATFSQTGSKASTDVISLYSAIGGMLEMENEACWRLWSLTEIVVENSEPSPYGVQFSDHMIFSCRYRLKYETESRSSVYVDYSDPKAPPRKLFNGVEEFLTAPATEPGALLR